MGYQLTIFGTIILLAAYAAIGLIPLTLIALIAKPIAGKFSDVIYISATILLNAIFFIGLESFTGYKISFTANLTLANITLAAGCPLLFFIVLDKLLDPVMNKAFPSSATKHQEEMEQLGESPQAIFIQVCLIAPVTEELLIRGIMLEGLQNFYGAPIALLLTTIIFSVIYFNFVQTISAAIAGLVLGLLYIQTDSLFCCILAHALYNTVSYLTIISKKRKGEK